MSKNRRRPLLNRYTPDGKRACRWCNSAVKPPRRTFCSSKCVHEHKIRSNSKYARQFIYQRDLGVCKICGIDTRMLKIVIEDLQKINDSASYAEICKLFGMTIKESRKSFWEADHLKEVIDGGGECGLDNYQTLCKKCHKQKTKESAKTRKINS